MQCYLKINWNAENKEDEIEITTGESDRITLPLLADLDLFMTLARDSQNTEDTNSKQRPPIEEPNPFSEFYDHMLTEPTLESEVDKY